MRDAEAARRRPLLRSRLVRAAGVLLLASATAEAQIATGFYVGDGAAPRVITGVGFRPDVVIVKVDFSNATDTVCSSAVIRTSTMPGDASKLMHGTPILVAPCASPSTGLIPNLVQSLDANGFTLGNDDRVNGAAGACGGANCTYHWVAFRANGNLRLGTYRGSGGTQSIAGVGFSPDFLIVMPANNNKVRHRTPAGGARSDRFDAGGAGNNGITSLDPDGFTVASASAPENMNAAGVTYHYAAWNAVPGSMAVGTYAGDAGDDRPIDLPGFTPRYLILQSVTDGSGRDPVQRMASMTGDAAATFRNAAVANRIQALRLAGFEVGTDVRVNTTPDSYAFAAFGDVADDPCSASGTWWNASWSRRRRIVFNNSGQGESLVDVAVLVKLDSSRVDYARTRDAGQDLRFVDGDDQTVLAHEIEVWDEAGTSWAWVRVPRVDASSTSDFIYMYYGNAGAADGQNATAVWTSAHRGVWHLKENPAGAPPQMKDSTGNANHGTAEFSPVQTPGPIDGSLQFDGTTERDVNVPHHGSLQLATNMTVSAWVRTTSTDDWAHLIAAKWKVGGSMNYWLGYLNTGPGVNTLTFGVDGGPAAGAPISLVNDGAWHHVAGVADAAGLQLRVYVDGVERATSAYTGASQTGTSELRIGRSPDVIAQDWDGGIDEVRVENVARSAAWVRAQYLSTSDRFATFGSEVGSCQLRSIGTAVNATAGTVSATDGSRTVTGSGTAWKASNRGRGDRITIDGTDYTVLTVVSDTELRLSSVFTGTSGAGKAYTIARKFTTLQAWESCVSFGAACPGVASSSLVTDNRSEVGVAYADSTFVLAGDVVLDGSVTDATHTITLTADGANRHRGTPGAGVVVNANLGTRELQVCDSNVTIEWLELLGLRGGAAKALLRVVSTLADEAPRNVVLQNLLVHDYVDSTPTRTQSGIRLSGDGGQSVTVRNSMIWAGDQYGIEGDEADDRLTIDSCTIDGILDNTDNPAAGIYSPNGTSNVLVRNTVVTGTGSRDYRAVSSFSAYSTNNVSEDLPGTGGAPGANALTGVAPADLLVVPGSNLHLKGGANAAVDSGATLGFLTDVDGQLRPSGAWDRGADERDPTTAVELLAFAATPLDGAVELSWQTASELRNLGFHLHRSTSASGPYERITALLVPAAGSAATGSGYSHRDTGLTNGVAYFYKLEDVDTSSRSTFHGPVSAVPGAAPSPPGRDGEGEGGGDGAQRVDSGPSSRSCPAWLLAASGWPGPSTASCTRHGDPDAVSIDVASTDALGANVELRTGGFWILHEPSGDVQVFVPGLDTAAESTAPALPLRRVLVDAPLGKQAQIVSVEALDRQAFRGLRPSAVGRAEALVLADGTVRPARRPRPASWRSRGYSPSSPARLAGTVFQGESKSAVVEISPVRFDGAQQGLELARLVRVRLAFTGRAPGEMGRGSRGRLRPRPTRSTEVLARLHTTRRGLHGVAFEALFPGVSRAVPASLLRLERQGEPVAFHVEPSGSAFGAGSVLYFLADARASSTDFSPEIAYELVRGAGQPMEPVVAPPDESLAAGAPEAEASFETNGIYMPHLLDAADVWLWQMVTSGAAPPPPLGFSLAGVDFSSSRAARLVVYLQGGSESGAPVDHHVLVSINGVPAGDASFTAMRPHVLEVALPVSALREGTNELALSNVGDAGVASRVFLDRFSVFYPRIAAATDGVLEGAWAESGTAEVAGVGASPVVLDVTGPPKWLVGLDAAGSSVRFRAEAGHRYLLSSRAALASPRVARAVRPALRDPSIQADYLLVAPAAFLDAARPLLERRASQGLRTRAASLEEIADEFGHGRPSGEAIRAFLAFAYHSWARPSPRYVVLLGDATYDPQRHLASSPASPLPARWERTSYLWTVSDPWLAAVNGDDALPDLAIGRLPAGTAEEAGAMVAKLLAWEDSRQDLSGNAVLVADDPDAAGDFEADVEDVRARALADRPVQLIKVRELGAAARPAILGAFDAGASLMSYVGHGGAAVWAGENVLNSWDVPTLLAQSRQPLLLTLDCLNGYFVAPTYDSLSEALLKAEGRGAIAAVSPSGLSLDGPAHRYHVALAAEVASGRHERLGDAVLAAQQAYARDGLMPELLSVYHLLGDPATRIR